MPTEFSRVARLLPCFPRAFAQMDMSRLRKMQLGMLSWSETSQIRCGSVDSCRQVASLGGIE